MRAWTQVKVTNADHPRVGQAGTTYKATADDATEVEVTFDLPNDQGERIELVKVADVSILNPGQ